MTDLREEWTDLLGRRPEFRETLAVYEDLLEHWVRWSPVRLSPLPWGSAECRARWERGLPLLAEAPPAIHPAEIEDLLGAVMERVAALREDAATGLQRLAEAWDRGEIGPASLFPARGRVGSTAVADASGLPSDLLAVLAYGCLRPPFERYFGACRQHLDEHVWKLGLCPFCGGPAGFSDVLESGLRRLACHLCGGGWIFSRTRCPFCGNEESRDLVRLEAENREQGYVIHACERCHAYLKELDRRVRWNAQSALVEDWGSPHLDLVAKRAGYWRAVPTLVGLA